jgi:hypothetical protein
VWSSIYQPNMIFRWPNGQYYLKRIPLFQNIEYRVSEDFKPLTQRIYPTSRCKAALYLRTEICPPMLDNVQPPNCTDPMSFLMIMLAPVPLFVHIEPNRPLWNSWKQYTKLSRPWKNVKQPWHAPSTNPPDLNRFKRTTGSAVVFLIIFFNFFY